MHFLKSLNKRGKPQDVADPAAFEFIRFNYLNHFVYSIT